MRAQQLMSSNALVPSNKACKHNADITANKHSIIINSYRCLSSGSPIAIPAKVEAKNGGSNSVKMLNNVFSV